MGQASSSRRNRHQHQQEQQRQQQQRPPFVPTRYFVQDSQQSPPAPSNGAAPALYPHAPTPQSQRPAPQKYEAKTTTVRNMVNLKKHTLKLTPMEGDAGKLDITFSIDAVQRCSISIFLMGHEDKKTGKITSSYRPLCSNLYCEAGLSISFPLPKADAAHARIDTSEFDDDKLHAANMDTFDFPLIIRLETLTGGDGGSNGHTLEERKPGDALPDWIQSQTTYAVLGHAVDDNDELVKVVKQRIWVNSQSYDLQEIYGITEAHQAAASGTENGDFSADCVVCLTNRKNTTLLPCRHFCMCHECARTLLKRSKTCPMCRLPISSLLQLQIAEDASAAAAA